MSDPTYTYQSGIIVSESDKKLYRFLNLENGLRVLLIQDRPGPADSEIEEQNAEPSDDGESEEEEEDDNDIEADEDDPKSKKMKQKPVKRSAASLSIGIGSFSDPIELQGLAHYLEHMVFMGSEKYPTENDFDAYISERGGSCNAWTDYEVTTFYFDVQRRHFAESLDRFAQFFVAPLMLKDSMDREVRAVTSEFDMGYTSDSNRLEQLLASQSKDNHPVSRFTTGNLKSLYDDPTAAGIDVYEYLKQFRLRHYSSDYMSLVVQTLDDLDVMENLVRDIFCHVPKNNQPRPCFTSDEYNSPFDTDKFRSRLYRVVPMKDIQRLRVTWSLPSLKQQYRARPEHLLGHILGHEGRGSIISSLRHKNLALELWAGSGEGLLSNSTCCLMTIDVTLTDEGLECYEQVIEVIFGYLKLLRREGISERMFKELQQIERAEWRFREEKDTQDNVERISANMQYYEQEHYICGHHMLFEYNPELLKNCVDKMTVEGANIALTSRKLESLCNEKEQWYDVKYSSEVIEAGLLKHWRDLDPLEDLHLPGANPFVATKFDLVESGDSHDKYPRKLSLPSAAQQFGELWYKRDNKFLLPKGIARVQLHSPLFSSSFRTARSVVLMDLLVYYLEQELCEDTYDAQVASLGFSIKSTWQGVKISVDGYNETLFNLYVIILRHIRELKVDEKLFESVKEHERQSYYNECFKPTSLNRSVFNYLLSDAYFLAVDKLEILETISCKDLSTFTENMLSTLRLLCYVHGNFTEQDALAYFQATIDILKCKPAAEFVEARSTKLPVGEGKMQLINLNPADVNSSVIHYYQSGLSTLRSRVICELLVHILEEPCFDFLRTKHQLGYMVYTARMMVFGVDGIRVAVASQADKHSVASVERRIEEFVSLMRSHVEEMPADQFKNFVASMVELKRVEDNCLMEEVDRNWTQLELSELMFDRLEKEIIELDSITQDEVMSYLKNTCLDGPQRRKLSLQVEGRKPDRKNKSKKQDTTGSGSPSSSEKIYKMNLEYRCEREQSDVIYWFDDVENAKKYTKYFPVHKVTQ